MAGSGSDGARTRLAVGLIVSLFFLWGIANNLNDVLIPHFRKAFTLSDLASGLVQSAFYLGYFLIAVPAALFMQKYGYKRAVIFGLCLYGGGALLFLPASQAQSYVFFLAALFVIAGGLAFLETAANPMVAALGPAEDAERRLNFAQAFNPLGSIAGILIGRTFILSGIERQPEEIAAMSSSAVAAWRAEEAAAVQMPYLVIGLGVLFWALLIALTRFPAIAGRQVAGENSSQVGGFRALFQRPLYLAGVLAQFCYVGAQVGLWSYTIRYVQEEVPGTGEKRAADLLILALILFMVGRFAGTALMKRIEPLRLLGLFASINAALALVAALAGGILGVVALTLASFFMSIMFPTIFAASLRGLGPLTKLGSSLIVMAIIGGAVITAAMGLLSDLSGTIRLAMLLPAGAFLVVLLFARQSARVPA
ncbi:L-fucose:H+ symporter permease [Allosphingosinicella deserti]|uniref:L-fucose:H+ symporter permease n=1 Tax=Allosphingosinicella deserti TaxID=2116704 RepID=A0A2P7QZ88_9SPHN|nr:L-fucose:H+ symporter permease [Sphingomonas deserti]PSJ43263.1 L-fucose:H+ symporter permease [Sphingomonas deserti]